MSFWLMFREREISVIGFAAVTSSSPHQKKIFFFPSQDNKVYLKSNAGQS